MNIHQIITQRLGFDPVDLVHNAAQHGRCSEPHNLKLTAGQIAVLKRHAHGLTARGRPLSRVTPNAGRADALELHRQAQINERIGHVEWAKVLQGESDAININSSNK